ncbi:hypothetical protein GF326_04985 [Candidatus Bathyarchaeota archaeon]|nr:hypothetical protein [Candidatus Bathyarchaeota archaeon]
MYEEQYRRPLRLERFQLRMPNVNVVMAAQIKEPITLEQLEAITPKLIKRHAFLSAHVVYDNQNNAYFEPMKNPEIPVQELEEDWENVVKTELRHQFDVETGPLIRLTHINKPQPVIIVNSHHIICDGLSVQYLIHDISKLLENPKLELEKLPVPPVIDDELVPVKIGNILTRFMINRLNKKWRTRNHHFTSKDYDKLHKEYWKTATTGITHWTMPEKLLKHLLTETRKHGVTITHLLTAALLEAQLIEMGVHPDYGNKVTISVNLRPRLKKPIGESYGYYASAVTIQHQYDHKQDIWNNASKIKRLMDRKLNDKELFASQQTSEIDPTLLDAIGLGMFGLLQEDTVDNMIQKITRERMSTAIITNLGAQQAPTNLNKVYGPILHAVSEKYVGITTINNNLTLTISYNEADIQTETIQKIIKTIKTKLEPKHQ